MLQLEYRLASDRFQRATVFGDPIAISNLYWQLTHNYRPQDGQAIGEIRVMNMTGQDVSDQVLAHPFRACDRMTTITR
jgi:hypothetical protein